MWSLGHILHECFHSFSISTYNYMSEECFEKAYSEKWGDPSYSDYAYLGWENRESYEIAKKQRKYYEFHGTYKQCMYGIGMFAPHPDDFARMLNRRVKAKNGVLVCDDADTLLDNVYGK